MGFIRKLVRALSSDKYRKNPAKPSLTGEQLAALNVGAINAEQVMCFCDSLETGEPRRDLARSLSEHYDIVDEKTAVSVLDWLRDRGHHVYFNAIKNFVAGSASKIDISLLQENERCETYDFIKNLRAVLPEMIREGFLGSREGLPEVSAVAWDMGRLVLVARCCFDLGYVSQETAWQYIEDAYEQCRSTYPDWRGVAQGYLLGRGMWNGPGPMLQGLESIANGLLTDMDSPWSKYALK